MNIKTWPESLNVSYPQREWSDELVKRHMQYEIDELRAALKAQPVQEPLPHWYTLASDGLVCLCADEQDAIHEAKKADLEYPSGAPRKAVRLYLAAPVQPAPLTDDQIYRINKNYGRRLDFARAIEAAVRTGGAG